MTLNKVLLIGELGKAPPFPPQTSRQQFYSVVKATSRSQWLYIPQSMGIAPRYLDGRNHPCPACGGHDRFQLTISGHDSEWGHLVTIPTLIARISKPDGSLAGLHLIYLDQAARKLGAQ